MVREALGRSAIFHVAPDSVRRPPLIISEPEMSDVRRAPWVLTQAPNQRAVDNWKNAMVAALRRQATGSIDLHECGRGDRAAVCQYCLSMLHQRISVKARAGLTP